MTDDQRCATCRFWNQYGTADVYGADRGYCEASCTTAKRREELGITFTPMMFCAERGHLDTEGTFGCVQWESKP